MCCSCTHWSLVDWFDTDGRRFVLAVPNPPLVCDPRGFTKREAQVAAYAALGDTHNMIAYRLRVSRPTVTNVMRAVRKKLAGSVGYRAFCCGSVGSVILES